MLYSCIHVHAILLGRIWAFKFVMNLCYNNNRLITFIIVTTVLNLTKPLADYRTGENIITYKEEALLGKNITFY